MMKTWKVTGCVVCALAMVACEGDKKEGDEEATAQQAQGAGAEAEEGAGGEGAQAEAKGGGEAEPAGGEDAQAAGGEEEGELEGEAAGEVPPGVEMEENAGARDELERMDMKGEIPEEFRDQHQIKGELVEVLGWRDKYGENVLAITIEDQKAQGEEKTKLLRAVHAYAEVGGGWYKLREFKERVANCGFDLELEPITGEWSVSDVDGDALGEGTFAYHAGCRSDVSPITHKVLMSEAGDKYALRGTTRLDMAGKKIGGEYKADPAFKGAPEAFLAHAKKAWEASVDEN